VNFRRVSDRRRAFQLVFGVTGISDDWYRSIMEAPATSLGAPMTSLGAPRSTGNKPGSASNKPGSTSNHCKAVWQKQHLWEHSRCDRKSSLLLIDQQFLKLMYSVYILIYVSI